ncbi:MAG: S-DNA-T family DNA segregation ATPase FtsK/SpoIIIE [Myxococcota bacterium]
MGTTTNRRARSGRDAGALESVLAGLRGALGDRQREVGLLGVLLVSTFAVVALIGFDPMDPVVPFQGDGDVINPCGPLGAMVAHGLFRVFGYLAYGSFLGMVGAVLALAGREVVTARRVTFAVLVSVTVLGLVHLAFGPGVHHPPGGLVGEYVAASLTYAAGPVGAWLVLLGALAVEMTVAGNVRWSGVLASAVDRAEDLLPHLASAVGRVGSATGSSLRAGGALAIGAVWALVTGGVGAVRSVGAGMFRVSARMAGSLGRAGGDGTTVAEWADRSDPVQPLPSDGGADDRTAVGAPIAIAEVEWNPTENASRIQDELLDLFPEMPPRSGIYSTGGSRIDRDRPTSPSEQEGAAGRDDVPAPVADAAVEATPAPRAEAPAAPRSAAESPSLDAPTPMSALDAPPAPAFHEPQGPGARVQRSAFLDAEVKDDGGAVGAEARAATFALPRLSLLDVVPKQSAVVDTENLRQLAVRVEDTLDSFKVTGEVTEVRVGPVVTTFEFLPSRGISVRKVSTLASDLAMGLCAVSVRIVAPIPGKGVVGIEIPSEKRLTIYLRELLASPEFRNSKHALPVALGKDVEGAPVVSDLAKMPHLLVGGTTGSGKSVGVNGMLLSLLYTKTPDELRLLLIDPKKLEFKLYEDIPHLIHPVVTEPKLAAASLAWACREMDQRYELLAQYDTRNIQSYNEKVTRLLGSWDRTTAERYAPKGWMEGDALPRPAKLPYIVIVIDELADLMLVAKKEVEGSIARLTQMARACGIHLIVATQRPSVDVVTGLIKSNLPTRISFKLRSAIDSRTVLDTGGAEGLLGRGDMLYLPNAGDLIRCHGAFVSDEEVGRVADRVREQAAPRYVVGVTDDPSDAELQDDSDQDEMYPLAVRLVRAKGKASTSMIQRHLKIGYNRAARIIEEMESRGVVGAADGARPREVLVD